MVHVRLEEYSSVGTEEVGSSERAKLRGKSQNRGPMYGSEPQEVKHGVGPKFAVSRGIKS